MALTAVLRPWTALRGEAEVKANIFALLYNVVLGLKDKIMAF